MSHLEQIRDEALGAGMGDFAGEGLVAAKFGGTSMGSASAIKCVAEIVESLGRRKVVIVSAMSGITDKLIALGEAAFSEQSFEPVLQEIIEKHETAIRELELGVNSDGVGFSLSDFWDEIRKIAQGISLIRELSLTTRDRLMSFGERASSRILAALLEKRGVRAVAVDGYDIVFTDNHFGEGHVNFEKTNEAILRGVAPMIHDGVVPVVTGFVGQAENGHYITLGRGGSDYSGAIVGAALGAAEVQIWTDVDGIMNADPRIVPEAKVLEKVSFNEAGELAYFGAKVLHPKTIKPAIEKNIPVRILNTFNVSAPGTLITNEEEESLKSVTYKKGICIVNICSVGMLEAHGFLVKIFEVFARHEIAVDVVATSEVSVSLTVEGGLNEIAFEELSKFAKVSVHPEMAIVCVVGEGIRTRKGVLGDLFSAVSEYDVNMVSQGSSQRNITFLVKESEAKEVVARIFNKFFI